MMYNFLGKDEKHREISTYFRLKHHCGKEVKTVYPSKNHETTHPVCIKFIYIIIHSWWNLA